MARPKGKGEKTKELIAAKAKTIFEQKGYAGTSMEDIQSLSKVSKGRVYYHFESKEELFLYTVRKTSEIWQEKWKEHAGKVTTCKEKLYLLAKYYALDMNLPLSQIVPEYMIIENKDGFFSDKIMKLIKPEFEIFTQIIEEGIRQKEFKEDSNPKDLAYILYTMLTGISGYKHFGYSEKELNILYLKAVDVFLKGIANNLNY